MDTIDFITLFCVATIQERRLLNSEVFVHMLLKYELRLVFESGHFFIQHIMTIDTQWQFESGY